MSLSAGTKLGPYEIVAPLGAGGMGEVYRAHDAKLKRDVAIKVLPPSVAGDAERLTRFEREAQALAALNHPNIATIYGLERDAIVMELIEGETLAERIARGAIPWSEALGIARQIADALEAAHEKGIVHRDLKPANIKINPDGVVKVLDFGLAKALDPTGSTGNVSESPTLTARATQMGVILGTAAYMSPEQARGKSVDRRADIWAFGCVLFEMVTGRRVFEGDEITDVLARLIERDPDWTKLPSSTAPSMRRLLERCLTKDVKARLRDIGEARIAIDEAIAGRAPVAIAPVAAKAPSPLTSVLPWGVAALFAVVAAVLWSRTSVSVAERPLVRVDLMLPADVEFFNGPALSADGSTVAFVGVREGRRQVFVRRLGQEDTKPVPGTDGAATVSVSPDGTQVVTVSTGSQLRRVSLDTGLVESLTDLAEFLSRPEWVGCDDLAYSKGTQIMLRSLSGKTERVLATADASAQETGLSWPKVTPNGKFILYTATQRTAGGMKYRIDVAPIAGGTSRVLLDDAQQVVSAEGGWLIYEQSQALVAVPFDSNEARTTGAAIRLSDRFTMTSTGIVAAAVSQSGAYVAAPESMVRGRLVWVSMTGVERTVPGAPKSYINPRVSADGRQIAFTDSGAVWALDPVRGATTRLSGEPEPNVGFSLWSPDSARVYFRSPRGIQAARADGAGNAVVLKDTSQIDYPGSFTPDGKTFVFLRISPQTAGDLYSMPAGGGPLTPILTTSAYEGGPQVSPDGKWLLYVSNETGQTGIYLRPLAGGERKWTVSGQDGIHPLWSRDGHRIFYRSGQKMMAVDFSATPDVKLGTPVTLFERQYEFGPNITIPNYSLSADGKEFLMVRAEQGGRHFNLVLNWLQHLGK